MAEVQPKKARNSYTIWAGSLFLLGGIATEAASYLDAIPADHTASGVSIASGIFMIVLRLVTKSPILFPPKK